MLPDPGPFLPAHGHPRWRAAAFIVGGLAMCAALAVSLTTILPSQPPSQLPEFPARSARSGSGTLTLTSPGFDVYGVEFSPDGRTLAAFDGDDEISASDVPLWDAPTGKLTGELGDPRSVGAGGVAFFPGGKELVTGDDNGSAYVWDVASRTIVSTLSGPDAAENVGSVAISPDGRMLAVTDEGGVIFGSDNGYVWDLATRRVIATLKGPGTRPEAVAFGPGGKILAVGDNNGTIYLWNTRTRRITATIRSAVRAGWGGLAFSPDGGALAAFGLGGDRVYLYDIGPEGT